MEFKIKLKAFHLIAGKLKAKTNETNKNPLAEASIAP